ncbi:MAG: hypothetical protein K2N99_00940, partial [Malacoplasma sp.]|nr:hypothetical protein [Malacoplasma sp.]
TIFDITDDEDEENCSIFDDKRTLHKDFYESEFYSIHKEVMTSDRFADMSKINSRVIINEATSYIPVIDYSTGVRVICIDTNDTDQYRLNVQIISRKIPFSYQTAAGRGIKLRILYLDDIKNRPMAVICALKKLIAFKYIKDRYKIKLNRNYVISYTTEAKWVEMFEKGDPDSHKPENSPTFQTKPANLTIGIIILDRKTYKDKRAIRRSQIMRDTNSKYEPVCAEDYDAQFVISARITKNDLRLRNPTLPKEERYVEYQITQYNEANPVIILDGFQVITACIIKEHKENYAPGTPYAISYEYDRGGLVSPSVVSMLDENDGVELSYNQRPNNFDVDGEYTLPPSRLKLDGVFDFEVGRLDKRLFSPSTIQRRYPRELWNNYDLMTKDGRIQFIRSRGFEEFLKPKALIFDVMPYALNMLETGQMISDILKINPTSLYDRNSRDAENLLFKQSELNYKKSLGDSTAGKFQMFLIETIDQW